MSPALRLLLRLHARAMARRAVRGVRTPKGAIFVAVGIIMFVIWLAPAFLTARFTPKTNPETVRLVAPLFMLLMCGLTLIGGSGDRAISFTPGEVNFLFPGPFTRRELLFYKLTRTGLGVLFSGLVFSVVLLQHASSWPAAAVGATLMMGMVQLLTLTVVMATESLGARAYTLSRRLLLGTVIGAAVIVLAPSVGELTTTGMMGAAKALQENRAARIVTAPFKPFILAFTAQNVRELAMWGSIAAAIDFALLLLIVRLDTDYREAALAASQRHYDRVRRMRQGQFAPQVGANDDARRPAKRRRGPRIRVPMFPWLGGVGPIAWRQLTAAVRSSQYMLFILLIFSVGFVPTILTKGRHFEPPLLAAAWLTVFLTMMLRFDFRAEIDQMPWLKAMPIRPTAVAAGQLATPVLILTIAQTLLIGMAAAFASGAPRVYLLVALLFLIPFNVLTLAVENLLFLLFPSRMVGAAPGDIGAMGRQIVFFVLKLLTVALACGLAAGIGIATIMATKSPALAITSALLTLGGVAGFLVPCVGLAYHRFDPSTDTPA